jgi:hypothetical protein
MASPTYYCSSNTQVSEEKSWNENKVLQWSNTDYKKTKKISVICGLYFLYVSGCGWHHEELLLFRVGRKSMVAWGCLEFPTINIL